MACLEQGYENYDLKLLDSKLRKSSEGIWEKTKILLEQYNINHDTNIRDEIAILNEKLIYEVIKKNFFMYICKYSFSDNMYDLDDIFQAGLYGLYKAVDAFDFSYGCMFSTCAVRYIITEIYRFLNNDNQKHMYKLQKLRTMIEDEKNNFYSKNGRLPTISELSRILNVSENTISDQATFITDVKSIFDVISDSEEREITIEDTLYDKEDPFEILLTHIMFENAISSTEDVEVLFRIKCFGEKGKTVAKEYRITPQAISTRVKKAKNKFLNAIKNY